MSSVGSNLTHCLEYSATIDRLGKVGSYFDRVTSLGSDVPSINAGLHIFQYC